MECWQLIDGSQPADSPEDFPRVAIESAAQLREELGRLQQRPPGIVALQGPDGKALQIGIGGPLAGVRLYKSAKPSQVVLADRKYSEQRLDFAAEEDTIAFGPENLIPVDQALEVIVHFYNHGRLPDWIGWQEWDTGAKRWLIKPANRSAVQAEGVSRDGVPTPTELLPKV